ncbi:STAS domain-containing protein [Actinoplanes subtropicus]|uniref:STAS domain-containing protein n=1 Tax=Actinoplanes subtropicus TaxID=543632 RepID=UPI0004C3B1F0|nr:STAS domain-containing protein [Actinoplanes subtropicus]
MIITQQAERGGVVRLTLSGELDLATADRLQQHVQRALAQPARKLVLDLAGVAFCDSTGLGALLHARNTAVEHGTGFQVTRPRGLTQRVLEVSGLLDILTGATDP